MHVCFGLGVKGRSYINGNAPKARSIPIIIIVILDTKMGMPTGAIQGRGIRKSTSISLSDLGQREVIYSEP